MLTEASDSSCCHSPLPCSRKSTHLYELEDEEEEDDDDDEGRGRWPRPAMVMRGLGGERRGGGRRAECGIPGIQVDRDDGTENVDCDGRCGEGVATANLSHGSNRSAVYPWMPVFQIWNVFRCLGPTEP